MSGFQSPISIGEAMEHIRRHEYLIPAFQREYVWGADQVERLFDSLMKGYPISSMLFWKVRNEGKSKYRFYDFLNYFIQGYHTHNEPYNTNSVNDFYAVLDGQQRLTSLYIGLFGSYAYHQYRHSYDYSENNYPTRHLYLNISKTFSEEESDMTYKFLFRDKKETGEKPIYVDANGEKWFKVGHIVTLHFNPDYDIVDFANDNNLERKERVLLTKLDKVIFNKLKINFYEEDTDDPDVAVNIFVRINSGGTALSFSAILLSLLIAGWKNKDAKTEINNLVDEINSKGFSISYDFILKSLLYLFHNDVRFKIQSFTNNFIAEVEDNWETIRDAILALFDLMQAYGFNYRTLTSYNATLPILYYIYHKGIYGNFANSVNFKGERDTIKQWLLKSLILRTFTGSSDGALNISRKAFTDDITSCKLFPNINSFPVQELSKVLKQNSLSTESYEQMLYTQKDDKFAFSILALLYPNLDYKNNNFHLDHLHPAASYKNAIAEWSTYNSILNLEMLDANENESKNDKPLKQWVAEETKNSDRQAFLKNHLIPDVDLSLNKFNEFIEARKALLVSKLESLFK